MDRQYLLGMALLFTVSALWGFGFVFQHSGMDHLGASTLNGLRFSLGALSVIPVILIFSEKMASPARKTMLKAGVMAGLCMFCGITLQQWGMLYTTAGKSAFVTGMYIIFVPLIGLFLGHRFGLKVWFAAFFAFSGLFLLSETTSFSVGKGELLTLVSAIFWAGVTTINGQYASKVDGPKYALLQFLVVATLSAPLALVFEQPNVQAVRNAASILLILGVLNTGVAMTMQVLAQQRVPALQAALVMSLETVFGAFGGWLLLNEVISTRMFLGGALMLLGLILAQLPGKRARKPIRWFFRRKEPRDIDVL